MEAAHENKQRPVSIAKAWLAIFALSTCLTTASAMTADSGTSTSEARASSSSLRWLTTELPVLTTNAAYSATLLVANATGTVTFSSSTLPNGLTLDTATGRLSGAVDQADKGNVDITFTATDGSSTINQTLTLTMSAAGGGGNAGLTWTTASLAQGRVNTAYSQTVAVQNVVGTVRYGAQDLPSGLSLNGQTGVISGTPTAAGTFFTTLTAQDYSDNTVTETSLLVLPLVVLPESGSFQWTKGILNNGEVGTAYTDTWTTSGGSGTVSYSGTGLPDGLSIDSSTGTVSGTPSTAGTYLVNMSASDGTDTITMNRTIWIAPSATSSLYWDYFGLPSAFVNTTYSEQLVARNPAGTLVYSAVGLPSGLSINANSGVISGTPTEVGLFPVTFSATDGSATVTLSLDFPVLPPQGGDTNSLSVNLWIVKQQIKATGTTKDSWKAFYIYNADRRTGHAFDPTTDELVLQLGANEISIPAGGMTEKSGKFSYSTPKGTTPVIKLAVDPKKQRIKLSTKSDTFPADSLPGTFRHTLALGNNKGYKIDEKYDAKGRFLGVPGYLNAAFVVADAKLKLKGGGKDAAKFKLYLADPSFSYTEGSSVLRFRVLLGTATVIDKTFTTLVTAKTGRDGTVKLKSGKDSSATNTLAKFSYETKKGKMSFGLKNADLSALSGAEAHVFVELTVGEKTYYTGVTLFAPKSSLYSTKMP